MLDELSIRCREDLASRPCLRVRLWIVEGNVKLQMVLIDAPKPLDEVQLIAMRAAHVIEPGLIVKSYGIDHQRISFVSADRIAPPGRIWICRVLSIHGNLQPGCPVFKNDVDEVRGLNELELVGD